MCAALVHRGGDDEGVEIAGSVGLANARLAILDPSAAGHQPMADPAARWMLTYNGEIYDHARWRRELPSFPYRGHCDTESLLSALVELGPEVLERCNGPFALAAYDREGRRLLLARDRFGIKPLYLARHRGAVWFASEIRALLAAGVPARPRVDVLAHAVGRGFPFGRATPLEGVERVLPGTTVSIDLDTLATAERTWFEPADMVDEELSVELAASGRAELVARLEEAVRTAVDRRLMSDAPVGTMCSGGLDSSLVTSLARREGRPIVAFTTAHPDAPSADERRHAERATRALGVPLQVATVSDEDWRRELVAAVRRHEYPLANPSAVPIAAMARLARAAGVKVLLTGEAADELFGGYSYLHGSEQRAFLSPALRLARAIERTRVGGLRAGARSLRRRLPGATAPSPWVDGLEPAAAVVEYGDARLAAARRAYAHHPGARGDLEAAMLAGLSTGGFAYLLNRMDKDAMAYSVETRPPFLDPELVRLALNLPLELRAGRRTKDVLREVARPHLPARVAARPKQPGLLFDVRRSIEAAARPGFLLDGSLREVLGKPASAWRESVAGASHRTALSLWSGEIWCRQMLGGESDARIEDELWARR